MGSKIILVIAAVSFSLAVIFSPPLFILMHITGNAAFGVAGTVLAVPAIVLLGVSAVVFIGAWIADWSSR